MAEIPDGDHNDDEPLETSDAAEVQPASGHESPNDSAPHDRWYRDRQFLVTTVGVALAAIAVWGGLKQLSATVQAIEDANSRAGATQVVTLMLELLRDVERCPDLRDIDHEHDLWSIPADTVIAISEGDEGGVSNMIDKFREEHPCQDLADNFLPEDIMEIVDFDDLPT